MTEGFTLQDFGLYTEDIIRLESQIKKIGIRAAQEVLDTMKKIQREQEEADIVGGADTPFNPLIREYMAKDPSVSPF